MCSKRKYSYQDRLGVGLSVVDNHRSLREAGKSIGADHKQVRRWVALYQSHGKAGLKDRSQRSYSLEFKISVLRYMQENHLSLFATSIKFDIAHESLISQWLTSYRKNGIEGLKMKKGKEKKEYPKVIAKEDQLKSREDLLKELEYLRAENALLKKLRVLVEQEANRQKDSGH